ncbi:hypothetical protein Tco_0214248 [Tanacetum coccineum]
MSANDNFSLHDDEELSLHDDASLAGSVPASNKGDAPAKPPQIITTNTLSNIKLPVLQKDDYDTWAMEMEHYLEYIDNEGTGKGGEGIGFPIKRVSSRNSVVVIRLRGVWEKVRVFASKLVFSFPDEFKNSLRIPSNFDDHYMALLELFDLAVHEFYQFFNKVKLLVNLDLLQKYDECFVG